MTAFLKTFSRPLALVLAGLPALAAAQFSYPGCTDLQPSDFQKTELVSRTGADGATTRSNMREPVAFDVHGIKVGDSVTHTDVYFVERLGSVVHYNGATKAVTQIGSISVAGDNDYGLMGIALDPNFATNKWLYLWYHPPRVGGSNAYFRGILARFTLNSSGAIDMASRKELINILMNKRSDWHSGGPMQFDSKGDLWLTIGNNSPDHNNGSTGSHLHRTDSIMSDEWGASNTANLRGGVIRIRPNDTATAVVTRNSGTYGPGYTIPAGNFGEYWADQFETAGNAARAAEYRDPAKVLPEIYVKGERSNHSIAIHPTRGWVGWGTVNFETNRDELNLITNPAFMGYPYFHGQPNASTSITSAHQTMMGYVVDSLAPRNTSPLKSGVEYLPKVTWPVLANNSGNVPNVIIAGPIYAYDRNLKSSKKFPPHLHDKWLAFTQNSSNAQAHIHTVDTTTVRITGSQRVDAGSNRLFSNIGALRHPLQGKYGPEGALYLMYYGGGNYSANPGANPAIVRVDYTGSCHLPPVSIESDRRVTNGQIAVRMFGNSFVVREPGNHEFALLDASGRVLTRVKGVSGAEYSLPMLRERHGLKTGVYMVQVRTDRGTFLRNVSLL